MESHYLLDTCICVYLLRGKYDVARKIDAVGLENCYISEITVAELKYGETLARMKGGKGYKAQYLDSFLNAINTLRIGDALDLYAEEKARLQLAGTPADDDFDLLIGCTAVVEGMTLVTENVRHFRNIRNLTVNNWIER